MKPENLLKKAASRKTADRAAALTELKRLGPMAAGARYVEDLTEREILERLHVLKNGSPEEIAALPPVVSRLSDYSDLSEAEIKERLARLSNR